MRSGGGADYDSWWLHSTIVAAVVTAFVSTVAPASAAPADIDSIEVTARKRVETLALVPEAVAVLTADDLTRRGLTTSADLSRATPNLLWHSQGLH